MIRQEIGSRKQATGIALVRKPVRRVEAGQVVREATTGRVVSVVSKEVERPKVVLLPRVWAVAEIAEVVPSEVEPVETEEPEVETVVGLAFYRKYTEAMLRRYVRLSMAAGRVPSLLGRELFRGNVTHYKVTNFEEVVVFCFDMEKLLGKLLPLEQQLIKRIGMQEYTPSEVFGVLGLTLRTCIRAYGRAVDQLTELLLEARMLELLK